MKRLFNFRLFLLLAILMLVATGLATYVFHVQKTRLIFFIICVSLSFIFVVLFMIFKYKLIKIFAISLFVIAIPFISIYAKSFHFNRNLCLNNEDVIIYGKLSGGYKLTSYGSLELVLDDVLIKHLDNEIDVDGMVAIYTNPENLDLSKFSAGTYLSVETNLKFYNLEEDVSRSVRYLNKGIVASGYSAFYNISLTGDVDDSLRDKIHAGVFNSLNDSEMKHPDVAYAMLFGDTSVLHEDLKDSFRATGIAHLLAVSGLHVSIIILLFGFVLKKLKVGVKLNLIISAVFLLFYCYLCNFSVSVIRASLMALFSLYALLRGKAYDNLSVLSLIAVVVLLINPLEMFNVSFVLSFSAVLSIILMAGPLKRIFDKVFYDKFSNVLAVNVSVQIGLLFTNIYYFGRYPLLGIFANMIAVPIATFAFNLLVIGVILSAIFPFMSFINLGFGYLMDVVVKFNAWVARLGMNFAFRNIPVLVMVLMFLFMFVLSDYFFANKRAKVITSTSLLVAIGLLMFV